MLDFAKAFDKVNHCKLTKKLYRLGVPFQVCSWIKDFLQGRSQRVVIDGEESDEIEVTSGVPQGSVIGPCLFLFYINDLPNNLSSKVRLFADDTILYNTAQNKQTIQEDLEKLAAWEREWDMEFNVPKCEHITFSHKKHPSENTLYLHGIPIPKAKEVVYLGVTLKDNLSFSTHTSSIAGKANAKLGFIRRNILTESAAVKERAYKQLVRPIMEYASASWDQITKTQGDELEAVQRRAARMVNNLRPTDRTTSVTDLISSMKWEALSSRRKHRRLAVFRGFHFNTDRVRTYLTPNPPLRSSRRHDLQYQIPHSRTKWHTRSYFIRTAKDWNKLPADSVFLVRPEVKIVGL